MLLADTRQAAVTTSATSGGAIAKAPRPLFSLRLLPGASLLLSSQRKRHHLCQRHEMSDLNGRKAPFILCFLLMLAGNLFFVVVLSAGHPTASRVTSSASTFLEADDITIIIRIVTISV